MNDTEATPDPASDYRLTFGIDGSVAVAADCNSATGAIMTWAPPQLQFSSFAATLTATLAACAPDSLAERYLAELGWVRSFVYRDGHLYLATMADGSIIEFAPLPAADAGATVGGLSLATDDPDALRSIILTTLLDAYATKEGVAVSDEEIDRYLAGMERHLREDLGDAYEGASLLDDEDRAAAERMRRTVAASLIRQWKINKSLHEKYGGRIIYQQFGPEPLDAYRAFLEAAQEAGGFRINRADLAEPFWAFFIEDERHAFMPAGSEDEARAFTTPPWARED
jgi:hypothetical protein